jgi:hypothetical protein
MVREEDMELSAVPAAKQSMPIGRSEADI